MKTEQFVWAPTFPRHPPHPFANLFPPVAAEQREKLAEELADGEQREPIILHDNLIVDGRARYEILSGLRRPAQCVLLLGSDLYAIMSVMDANAPRLTDRQLEIVLGKFEALLTSPVQKLLFRHLQERWAVTS